MPFREAHHATGTIVGLADDAGCALADLPLAAMQKIDSRITQDVFSVLSFTASLASRTSEGGTAPANVRAAAAAARERFL
jgi:argininosuccinate lyase